MKNTKKILGAIAFGLTITAVSVTAFAASKYNSPAEAVAGLTGRTTESVIQERKDSNKKYGEIAKDAGKLEEFKTEKLEIRKERLNNKVSEGKITSEKAEEVLKTMEEKSLDCDGLGSGEKLGLNLGMKLGGRQGQGNAEKNGLKGNLGQGEKLQKRLNATETNE